MPLATATFLEQLSQFFVRPPAATLETSASVMANEWATIYLAYASTANAGVLVRNPVGDPVLKTKLHAQLAAIFALNIARTPLQFATDLQAALTAFWFAPPQTFIPIPPVVGTGVIAVVPPTLAPALLPVLASNVTLVGEIGSRTAGRAFATTIDAWTRTITASIVITPPGPPPVIVPLL